MLGINSGLRAKELYQLRMDDFDLDNCTVFVNHNPVLGQITKNKKVELVSLILIQKIYLLITLNGLKVMVII